MVCAVFLGRDVRFWVLPAVATATLVGEADCRFHGMQDASVLTLAHCQPEPLQRAYVVKEAEVVYVLVVLLLCL